MSSSSVGLPPEKLILVPGYGGATGALSTMPGKNGLCQAIPDFTVDPKSPEILLKCRF